MYRRILVLVDASATSSKVLAHAIGLARANGSMLKIVHVMSEPFVAPEDVGFCGTPDDVLKILQAAAHRVLGEAAAAVSRAGLVCELVLEDGMQGRRCDLVLAAATEWAADLLVLGTWRSASILTRALDADLNADTDEILVRATVPLLVLRCVAGDTGF